MPDSSSLIGQIIWHYRIVAKVGVGGMGEVYRVAMQSVRRFTVITTETMTAGGFGVGDGHMCSLRLMKRLGLGQKTRAVKVLRVITTLWRKSVGFTDAFGEIARNE
jgi:hypothetical protein